MKNWERVNVLDTSGDDKRTVEAECRNDSVVLGGGFYIDDERVTILESLPEVDGSGWRVRAVGPELDWHLRVYAICAARE